MTISQWVVMKVELISRVVRHSMYKRENKLTQSTLPSAPEGQAEILLHNILSRWRNNDSIRVDDDIDSSEADTGGHSSLSIEDDDVSEAGMFDWDTFEYRSGLSAWDGLGESYAKDAAAVGELSY